MAVTIGTWLLAPHGMCLSLADLHDMVTKPSEHPEPPFEIHDKTERLCVPRGRPIRTTLGNKGGRNASPCTKRRHDKRKPNRHIRNSYVDEWTGGKLFRIRRLVTEKNVDED